MTEIKDGISLKEYIDTLREADLVAVNAALKSLDKRLDLLNELRGNVLTREEHDASAKQLEQKIERNEGDIMSLQLTGASLAGKASQSSLNVVQLI